MKSMKALWALNQMGAIEVLLKMKFEFEAKKSQREISIMVYCNYQLRKARRKFGDLVLALKLRRCHGQRTSFSLVTISTVRRLRAYNFARFAANDAKGRQVAHENGASCL